MKQQIGFAGVVLTLALVLCAVLPSAAAEEAPEPRALAAQAVQTPEEQPAEEQAEEESGLTLEQIRAVRFVDIPSGTPESDAAGYLAVQGILPARDGDRFDPYAAAARGEAVTALWRMSGEKAPEGRQFTDVGADTPCAAAAAWADAAGIAGGSGENLFQPERPLTRGQLAAMLCRYAEHMGIPVEIGVSLDAYPDGAAVSGYAREPMSCVLGQGIYKTIVGERLLTGMEVSRLQLAQALVGLAGMEDGLAAEIHARQPERDTGSIARSRHQDIQTAVDTAARRYGAIGVQVAVVEDGRVTDTYNYGWAERNTAPMTAEYKIRVASISKVVVGMAAMILREEGTVDLDESIGAYWGFPVRNPYYPENPITIRKIMTHTSSIFNAGDDEPRQYGSVCARLKGSGFSRAVPGNMGDWNYNNYAFGVLGMTLELASGRHMNEILRDRLFDVMEIDGSFAAGELRDTGHVATLYYHGGSVGRSAASQCKNRMDGAPGAVGTYFAGGLTISARDMAKLIGLLAGDGRYEGVQLLSEESVELMEHREEQAVPGGSYQALPLRYQYEIYGRNGLYYHTGSAYGVYNCASYDPETGDGVVVLTVGADASRDQYGIYAVCGEISQKVYDIVK